MILRLTTLGLDSTPFHLAYLMYNHLMVHSSSVRVGLISNAQLSAFLVSFRSLATILFLFFFQFIFFSYCVLSVFFILFCEKSRLYGLPRESQTNKDLRPVTLAKSDSNQFEGRKQVSFYLFYKCSHERLPRIKVMDCC